MRSFTSLLTIALLLLFSAAVYGQNSPSGLWTTVDESSIPKKGKRYIFPKRYQTYKVDLNQLKKTLSKAPMTKTAAVKTNPCYIDIPWNDGSFKKFQIIESPIMEKGLAAKFPEIKTYAGSEVGNGANYIRLDLTPQGFHAIIFTVEDGTVYVDPYSHLSGDLEHYIVYNKKDFHNPNKHFQCGVQGHAVDADKFKPGGSTARFGTCELRVYRMALAGTGEYTAFHGGTVALAQAAQVTTMNRVNGVYIRELAIQFNLVTNNNLLIYTNANTDPYTNGNAGAMITENVTNINNVIGSANYDIGHVFGTNSGGLAGLGVICTSGKARGVTGGPAPVNDPFDIDYVCHEVGHQFGANHTQNNSCQRNLGTAMEPGSASTIMGYAGICAPNVQNSSDDYFHGVSLQEMSARIQATSCPVKTALANSEPVITSTTTSNITIPANTPFKLTATATDANPTNTLTYCWEQMDNQAATMPPVSTNTVGPAFRSFSPSIDPTRYFPNLGDILTGTTPTWEVLPSVTRTMNFRVTVRDNAPGGGCSDHEDITINVDGNSGPFIMTYPSATGITWAGLSTETVTWNVANTDIAPVACATVDILLSTNGGFTYPTVLASGVPNDGSHPVVVPNVATTSARIMVVCSNGSFFDVSDNNFTITTVSNDFTLAANPDTLVLCPSSSGAYIVNVGSVGSFSNTVNLSISGVPTGATANFSPSSLIPSGSSTLTINNSSGAAGVYSLTLSGTSTTGTKTENLVLILDAAPTVATLTAPSNGATGVSPAGTFTWNGGGTASETYTIEIATDPGFNNVVENVSGLTTTNYTSSALVAQTTYYWQVRVTNSCGTTSFSSVFSFTTNNCTTYNSANIPVNISASGTPTITSTVNIPNTGTINDVNVVNLTGTHTYVSDLTVSLASPAGTSVQLFSGICNADDNFDLNFDDTGAATIPCPPTTGLTYQPNNPLSAFNNENQSGTWTLTISDGFNQDGGDLLTWGVEVCVNPPVVADAGISAVIAPPDSVAICDNPLTPKVVITNFGSSILTSATINYNIDGGANNTFNWTGSLATGNSDTVTLNPITAPTPNIFTFMAYTTAPNGGADGSAANDTSSSVSQIVSALGIAYLEDFEGGAMPANLLIQENPVGGPVWVHNNSLSAYGVGTGSVNLDNYNTDTRNSIDLIYLPWLDFSSQSGVEMTFDVAYARYNATFNDTLAVYASNDCGQTFSLVYRKGGSDLATAPDNTAAFTPTNAEWRNDTVDLSAYDNSSHIRIIIVNEGGYGNIVHLDNINVAASNPCNLAATVNTQINVDCNGNNTGSVTFAATGGTAPYSYNIGSGAQTSGTFSALAAGTYTVTITDANGCTAVSNMVTLTEPVGMTVSTTANDISCLGAMNGSITTSVSGGAMPYSYSWNNGATNANLSILNTGTYTVTITDNNGCTTVSSASISQPALLSYSSSSINVSCAGGNDGVAAIAPIGGTTPYSYNWSNGTNSETATGLAAGTYSVTVTDANGCTTTQSYIINEPGALTATIADNGNSTATASGTGGIPPYSYTWDNNANNQTTPTATGLVNNSTYTITVTDANGCTATANVTIVFNGIADIPNLAVFQILPNPNNGNFNIQVGLATAKDVNIRLTNVLGQVLREYNYNQQQITIPIDIQEQASGIYFVVLTTDNKSVTQKITIMK